MFTYIEIQKRSGIWKEIDPSYTLIDRSAESQHEPTLPPLCTNPIFGLFILKGVRYIEDAESAICSAAPSSIEENLERKWEHQDHQLRHFG